MDKNYVIDLFKTGTKVADCLGLNKSAISLWPDDIPRLREFEINEILNTSTEIWSQRLGGTEALASICSVSVDDAMRWPAIPKPEYAAKLAVAYVDLRGLPVLAPDAAAS